MLFVLFIAILLTLYWINTMVADSITAKINPYAKSEKDIINDENKAKFKNWLIVIIALCWAVVIRFL